MKQKTNFLKKFIMSIYDIDVFSKYIREGILRAILYSVLMTTIVSSLKCGVIVYSVNKNISNIVKQMDSNDSLYIKDGELNLNRDPISIESSDILIYIDGTEKIEESWKLNNKIYNQDMSILLLKNGTIFYNNGNVYKTNYKDFLGNKYINVEDIEKFLYETEIYIGISIFIINIGIEIMDMFINCLIITLIASLIAMFMKMIIKYTALYSMALYAATLPFIIKIILESIELNVNLNNVFIIGTLTYIIFILKHIKTQILQNSK
ncbi:MAG: DUF1189 domain-containing protein [Clostridium butyricum]|nr:DUF1189 domain-containing protein [Clostridium butyricum]